MRSTLLATILLAASCTLPNPDFQDGDATPDMVAADLGPTSPDLLPCQRGTCHGQVCSTGRCRPALSCNELRNESTALPDGTYEIDDDGTGPKPPFRARCDMTTLGGGWTLVAHLEAGTHPIESIYRGARFFTTPWVQEANVFTVKACNTEVSLDSSPGMLDARTLLASAAEIRLSCKDRTRKLSADAAWRASISERAEWLNALVYSPAPKPFYLSKNAGPYQTVLAYPTATPSAFYGSWHICGKFTSSMGGFQIGVCHNGPTEPDQGLSDINQIAIGYHPGFSGIRLECTRDTPQNVSLIDGYWQAWVR